MDHPHDTCPYTLANDVQFQSLRADLADLKQRVVRLETALTRGLLLLIANLGGMVVTLLHQLVLQ